MRGLVVESIQAQARALLAREPAAAGRLAGIELFYSRSWSGQLRASNYWTTGWLISVDPSGRACRNNLDRDVHRRFGTLITHEVYVPATEVSEALTRVVDDRRTVGTVSLVHRELSSHDRDKARTRMGMPPSMRPRLERVFGDIEVRIASHPCEEKPGRQVASTHQVEQAGREVTGVRSVYRLSRV